MGRVDPDSWQQCSEDENASLQRADSARQAVGGRVGSIGCIILKLLPGGGGRGVREGLDVTG
jgi:hypothetical protein